MPEQPLDLAPEQYLVLAVDTASEARAEELATVARDAGVRAVKLGLEYLYGHSPAECAELADDFNVDWIADFKLHDIPNTTAKAVEGIVRLPKPPIGITIHTRSGVRSLQAAQEVAKEAGVMLFGVSLLTSIDEDEAKAYEKAPPRRVVWRESRRAVAGHITGLVCSGQELGMIRRFKKTNGLYTLVPGTRSEGVDTHDQRRSITPAQAIRAGADLLVIGRQVTEAARPPQALELVRQEVEAALEPLEAAA